MHMMCSILYATYENVHLRINNPKFWTRSIIGRRQEPQDALESFLNNPYCYCNIEAIFQRPEVTQQLLCKLKQPSGFDCQWSENSRGESLFVRLRKSDLDETLYRSFQCFQSLVLVYFHFGYDMYRLPQRCNLSLAISSHWQTTKPLWWLPILSANDMNLFSFNWNQTKYRVQQPESRGQKGFTHNKWLFSFRELRNIDNE